MSQDPPMAAVGTPVDGFLGRSIDKVIWASIDGCAAVPVLDRLQETLRARGRFVKVSLWAMIWGTMRGFRA